LRRAQIGGRGNWSRWLDIRKADTVFFDTALKRAISKKPSRGDKVIEEEFSPATRSGLSGASG
jgi:hypothetical protein